MDKYRLIGIGEILWDEFPARQLGGAPANFAYHAGQLGGDGMTISRIGDDLPGKDIKALLDKKKVPYLLSIDKEHPTGRVSVKTDDKGTPEYIIHENTAWDFLTFEPYFPEIAAQADAVCFGTLAQRNPISAKAIKTFIRATKKDCLKIFDVNLRQNYYSKTIISELLYLTNVLKLNNEEFDILSQMFLSCREETACLEELISMFCLDYIVLTRGENGSRIFMDNQDSIYKSKPVEVVDSVGAGDSFAAVVALGILKGLGLEKINETANLLASYVCANKGATPVIPKRIIHSMN